MIGAGETGSRQVVETMFKDWDDLSLKQKRRLNGPQVKRLAGTILDSYLSASKRAKTPLRSDFENMQVRFREHVVVVCVAAVGPSGSLKALKSLGLKRVAKDMLVQCVVKVAKGLNDLPEQWYADVLDLLCEERFDQDTLNLKNLAILQSR